MFKSLRIKFLLLLLAVSAIALSAALLLRELLVADFRDYLEGEMEDRVYWVTAALESIYERDGLWKKEAVVEPVVWALMLGFDVKLLDGSGRPVMGTDEAVETLTPLVRKRVKAISEPRNEDSFGKFAPYALFLAGKEIGRLEVRFLKPRKEEIFIERSNRLLLVSMVALGGVALLLSLFFARRLTGPIRSLTDAASAIGSGELGRRVPKVGSDEIGKLSDSFNRMAQALERQETLRKRLTSNIAHELRTPITAIRGELEGMMDGYIPMDGEHVQSLYAEIGRLRKMIEAMEELARAEASALSLEPAVFPLRQYLMNIADRFAGLFGGKDVSLAVTCGDDLLLYADPERLSQVLINLLSNALKATGAGGHVTVSASDTPAGIVMEVSDTGTGIRPEDLPHIFERFYRAGEGGLGIGLTIVKELVEAHGGSIACRSEYGSGSTFIVTLPHRPS